MSFSPTLRRSVAPLIFSALSASLSLVFLTTAAFGAEIYFDFAKENPDEALSGFLSTVSGEGKPGIWKLIDAEVPSGIPNLTPNAPAAHGLVLAQLSRDLTDEHYPILVYTNQ